MSLFEKLKRPFAKRIEKVAARVRNFFIPINSAMQCFTCKFPNKKKFLFKDLSSLQKLIFLTIAVTLPACIFVVFSLARILYKIKRK